MSPILTGVIASGISGNLTPLWSPEGAFDALATVTSPSGGLASVTFTGIPTGYKHLQIRAMHLYSGSGANLRVTYNSGSANAITHFAYGSGSSTGAGNDSTDRIITFQSGATSTAFCVAVWDILDYSSTSKAKVLKGLVGQDTNGAGIVGIVSGLNTSTDAINSLTLSYASGATIQQYSSFALYGVK